MLQRLSDEAQEASQQIESEHPRGEEAEAIDATAAHVAMVDAEGRVIAVNHAWRVFDDPGAPPWARRLTEGESYLSLCENSAEATYSDESGDVAAGLREVLSGERELFSLEYPCHAPSARRWFVMRVTRLPGAAGALITHEDITERRRGEKVARQRQAQLARHDHALAELGRALAHDLRVPLRSISQLIGWIEEDAGKKLSKTGRHHLELLRDRVERVNTMMTALVDYIRFGDHTGAPGPVDLGRLLEKLVRTLTLRAGVTVEIVRPMPVLRTERGMLQRVFLELIENAIALHGGQGGHILITATPRDGVWEFAVHDDGPDLDEAQRERLSRIFQTHGEDPRRGSLGVALAYRLVEEHGGALSVRSRVGEGTTVRFTWPESP